MVLGGLGGDGGYSGPGGRGPKRRPKSRGPRAKSRTGWYLLAGVVGVFCLPVLVGVLTAGDEFVRGEMSDAPGQATKKPFAGGYNDYRAMQPDNATQLSDMRLALPTDDAGDTAGGGLP